MAAVQVAPLQPQLRVAGIGRNLAVQPLDLQQQVGMRDDRLGEQACGQKQQPRDPGWSQKLINCTAEHVVLPASHTW